MTRQDQFKEELFALLRKYNVEMTVVEIDSYNGMYADGINFYGGVESIIDLTVGKWENGNG